MIRLGNSYNQSVNNVTVAGSYNINLKEDIDYILYRMIVGSISVSELEEKTDLRNPYDLIAEARGVFASLENSTTGEGNEKRIRNIMKCLDNLTISINEIDSNIIERGHYDKNQLLLDNNIHVLTELTQENIQSFIYYEARNLEVLRIALNREQKQTVRLSVLLFCLVFFIVIVFSLIASKSIVKPIKKLCDTAELVAQGDFTTRAEEREGDEIATLTYTFNSMIGQIGDLIENIKEEQLNLRITELKLLQAQINPHFLYNTLDTIIWLAEANKTSEVVNMVTSLSDFFRTALSEGRTFITVKEEVSHIRSYLEIQQLRYQDFLTYEIDIPESIYYYSNMKLTLQPLVENALYHGIKNKRGSGKISVRGRKVDDELIFTVEDDGIGMPEEMLAGLIEKVKNRKHEVNTHGGFGLVNVEERIKLNYGDDFGLSFTSSYHIGTVVTVRIPAILYSSEENVKLF